MATHRKVGDQTMGKLISTLAVLLIQSSALVAQTAEKPAGGLNVTDKDARQILAQKRTPVALPKLAPAPLIDGKLDEAVWKQAAVFKDFYQTSPGYNIPPSKPTEAYALYDDEALYFGFKCWDDPDKIRSTVAARDAVADEDNVRVWLDTFNDRRRAYELVFNPLGIQQDGIFVEGQGSDYSIDILMESKGTIQEWGWSVEVRIPFKSLRYRAGPGRLWGINFARTIHRFNHESDQWMPDDRNISGTLIKHGRVTGIEDISLSRSLSVVVSTTVSETGKRERAIPLLQLTPSSLDSGHFVNLPVHDEVGATIKYVITPNLTFDVAINPDFAEIEADAPVVTVNNRFPIYYPEKRPFFLEGLDILKTPNQLFHSRRIVDPDLAAKLAGKVGKVSLGILFAVDTAAGDFAEDERNDPLIRPAIDEFIGKKALVGVLRIKRDVGEENSVGVFASVRSFPEQHNGVFGFDSKFKPTARLVANFSAVSTISRSCFFEPFFDPMNRPGRAARNREVCGTGTFEANDPVDLLNNNFSTYNAYRTGEGFGYSASLDYTAKNRGWSLGANGKSRDYVTDVGYTERANRNAIYVSQHRNTEPRPDATLISFNWASSAALYYDWDGRLQDFNGFSDLEFTLQHNTMLILQPGIFYERLHEDEFGLARLPARSGAFVGEPERSAWQGQMVALLTSSPVKRFNAALTSRWVTNAFDYDLSHYPLNPGTGVEYDLAAEIGYRPMDSLNINLQYSRYHLTRHDTRRAAFNSNIASLRSTYQFSRFTFARLRLDYDSITRRAASQVLFGWNPSPGTAVYFGYNDDLSYNGLSPFTGQYEPRIRQNSHTIFLRLSYLFQRQF